ncbi:ATP-binding protein [Alloacidobacterium sp.]|uniref:ATP-binding protein n=1 Tax=Alloacidobacterium sp. TaxID=2951999 RepID=UPI002D4E06C1|nr:ATP-binding protein [Alloacidobacterium sp.]HYK35916.1 ATP-binding protein [Alloacidobacterium sp.]
MTEFYRIPVLALLSMLLVVFVLLYLQARTTRRLLWLVGWSMTTLHLATEVAGVRRPSIGFAVSNAAMILAAMMFLGSMSPLAFKRWPRFLYVYAFAAPLLLFAVVISIYPQANGWLHWLLVLCAFTATWAAMMWGLRKNLLPRWLTAGLPIVLGAVCIWITYDGNYSFVLFLAQSASNLMTALLFAAAYRRWSPGVMFTSLGFFLWSMPAVIDSIFAAHGPPVMVGRGLNLVKVMTAVGMILLVLEDELAQNKVAKERDYRARMEMERYSEIDLSLLSGVNADAAYQHACEVIVAASRFSQALLFLRSVESNFHVVAHAGMDDPLVVGLEALGKRVTPEQADRFRHSESVAIEMGNTLNVDLRPLFVPSDPLDRLQYHRTYAIPLETRKGTVDGCLFLGGLKQPEQPLRPDDLLPVELLVARLAAMREHNALMQRIARSEKLAGLGQMAAGVAHELNNPLTVVLGYSEILQETLEGRPEHENMSVVRGEAQRMKQIIESMLRFWRPSPVEHVSVSLTEILRDICQLRRTEFNRRQIDLQLHIADDLPEIDGNRSQLQQMFLHLINNSVEVFSSDNRQAKTLRVDVSHDGDEIRVLISDNGPGFVDPDRAFDPFSAIKSPRAGAGKGLSVCYAIVRDHGGEITAHNLQPHGAALVVQLPLPRRRNEPELSDEALAH